MSSYSTITIEKLPRSEVEIKGAIDAEAFSKYRARALKNLGADVEISGFRKGLIPEKVLVDRLGEHALHEEIAELALRDAFPLIIIENDIDLIGRPDIKITKLAPGNPIEFVAKMAVIPKFDLPDYRSVALDIFGGGAKANEINEKEIADAIENLRREFARLEKAGIDGSSKEIENADGTSNVRDVASISDEDLPSIEYVLEKLRLNDIDELRLKIKEQLSKVEALKLAERKRGQVIEKLITDVKLDLPDVLVDSEIQRQKALFASEIERAKMTLEDYLKQANLTEKDFSEEFRGPAIRQATSQLIFDAIAMRENLVPSTEKVDEETNKIISAHADTKLDRRAVSAYVFNTIRTDQVWKFLENLKN